MNKVVFVVNIIMITLVISLIGWKYIIYFQHRDFYLLNYVACTEDENGRCFKEDCIDADSCMFDQFGYKEVTVRAESISCEVESGHVVTNDACDPFLCEESADCQITYCDPEESACL